jgi:hypothetical protein
MATIPYRLQRLLQHRCDIYRPVNLGANANNDGAADPAFETTPAYTNVMCYYQGTPEFDTPTPAGITLDVNIMTSDRWWFLQDQKIEDTWMIVMRTPGHPLNGRGWIAQGNNLMIASMTGRDTRSQMIYTRQAPNAIIPGA